MLQTVEAISAVYLAGKGNDRIGWRTRHSPPNRSEPPDLLEQHASQPCPYSCQERLRWAHGTPPGLAAPPLQTTGAFRDGLTPSPTATPSPTPTTTLPAAGRPSQRPNPALTFVGVPLSAQQGQTVTLDVRTAPNTDCSIDIAYPSALELDPATSDGTGNVSWTWRVGKHVQPGSWPITVSCRSGNASTQITVR